MASNTKKKDERIENAIAGGLVGAALGALLTNKSEDTIVASLVGAAIGASLSAIDEAKDISTPVMYEENGKLYKQYSNGKKEFVKNISKHNQKIPPTFSID